MTMKSSGPNTGFGKRGRVNVGSTAPEANAPAPRATPSHLPWIGGGLAAVAVMALIAGGTGGGGLLGGLIGGLLGKHLADRSAARSAPQVAAQTARAPAPAAATTTVQRSGFGTTASSGSGGSFSSGS